MDEALEKMAGIDDLSFYGLVRQLEQIQLYLEKADTAAVAKNPRASDQACLPFPRVVKPWCRAFSGVSWLSRDKTTTTNTTTSTSYRKKQLQRNFDLYFYQ